MINDPSQLVKRLILPFVQLFFAVLLLSWPFTPALADDTVNIDNLAVSPGESAAQCYADAIEHLRKGAWYERAATQLKEAVRQDPKNSDYHMALGCAYADRAASLGYAAGFWALHNQEVAQYPKDLADWQKAQLDPKNSGYGSRRPVPPPAFTSYTKDDLETFTLTIPEVIARVDDLAKQAQAEWKEGVALAKDAKARANAEYVQGWGLDLLAGYRLVVDDPGDGPQITPPPSTPDIPTNGDAVKTFEAAIKDDPTQAIYWQSLGDALGPPSPAADLSADQSNELSDSESGSIRSMAAYRHALALDPKNALLWWNLAQFEVRTDPAKAVDDLNEEITADPTNAYPFYILADSELKQTHYINNYLDTHQQVDLEDFVATENIDRAMSATITGQDRKAAASAIFLVQEGNNAPFCHYPVYHPAVPTMLTIAFDYLYRSEMKSPAYLEQDTLAHDLCGYADVTAMEGNVTGGIDIDRDIVAMGMRMVGDWSFQMDWRSGHSPLGLLVGIVVARDGYTNMVRNAQHYGDPGMAQAAQEESDAFTEQQTQFRDSMRQSNFVGQMEYLNY